MLHGLRKSAMILEAIRLAQRQDLTCAAIPPLLRSLLPRAPRSSAAPVDCLPPATLWTVNFQTSESIVQRATKDANAESRAPPRLNSLWEAASRVPYRQPGHPQSLAAARH